MSKKFAESVAPAQADKLLCSLMEDENDEELIWITIQICTTRVVHWVSLLFYL